MIYIPLKPAKYGLKVWWVNDSDTCYPLLGQLYTGLAPNGERVAKELCEMYKGSGRQVTCDNFFTTLDLAKRFGTVNKRRIFVPKELLPKNTREVLSTTFVHNGNVTLASYVPKKNMAVLVMSTSHYKHDVSEDEKKKPLIIKDYNKTKGGTDTINKMLSEYTCHRRTKRWPLAFFYNMIDVAGLASFIIL